MSAGRHAKPFQRFTDQVVRGPLLSSHTPLSPHRISSDARLSLMNLYSSLATPPLVTAIYPGLHAYTDPDRLSQSDVWTASVHGQHTAHALEHHGRGPV